MTVSAVRIGIDIGGTKTHGVALGSAGDILAETTETTQRGAGALVESIVRVVGELARATGTNIGALESVGIGVPGQVDFATGTVRQAINLDVVEWHAADEVHRAMGIRPSVDNDVNAAALGARAALGIRGTMAYLNLGTGIAAGVHLDGGLLRGSRGAAGEIGHISIDPRGPLCDCGQSGCIEAFAGGRYLAERARSHARYPLVDIIEAADSGDSRAGDALNGFAFGIAGAVRTLCLSFDVDQVILGGGVIAMGARIENIILEALADSVRPSVFLRSLDLTSRISFLPGTLRAPAVGAALLTKDS